MGLKDGYLYRLDHQLARRIQGWPASLRPFMLAASAIGHPAITGLGGLLAIILAHETNHPTIFKSFLLGEVVFGLSGLLKILIHRKRPATPYAEHMRFKTYSFPSGHTFGTIVMYGLLGYIASRHLLGSYDELIAVLSFLLIGLVGLSRVYLGAHYPTDVLAGWALGGLSLIVIISLAFH